MSERTRIVLTDVSLNAVSILQNVHLLRELRDGFGWADFDSRSAAISAGETFCYWYLSEHEPVVSKLENWPGQLVFALSIIISRRFVSRYVSSEDSMSIGGSVGALVYRLVFGVVLDVPESRFDRPSLLDWWRRFDGESSK
jgi:uncharacterized BrkB/YihY/UPF0761 family membrane protein